MASPASYMLVGYPGSPSSSPNLCDAFIKFLTPLAAHHQIHVAARFMACSSNAHGSQMTEHCFNETVFDTDLPPQVLTAAHDYAAATIRNSESPSFYFGHDADKAVRQYMDQQRLLATPLPQHTIISLSPKTTAVFEDCDKTMSEWFSDTHGDNVSLTPSEDDGSILASFDGGSEDEGNNEGGRIGFGFLQNDEMDEWCLSSSSREICRSATGRRSLNIADYIDKMCEVWLQTGTCERASYCPFSHQTSNPDQATVLADEDFPELSKHRPLRTRSPSLPNYADVARRSAAAVVTQPKPSLLGIPAVDTLAFQLGRPAHIPWLETGDPLMRLYHNERKRAHELGGQMNRYFKLSQKCYHQQDWYNAREYAEEARHYQKEMKRLHTQASRRIFEQRNQQDALFIDLHGMHVDEAKESINQWFKELENSRHRGIVYIVTGTGHHSRRGSRLRPAVASFLKTMYRCEETSVRGDNKGGVFSVYFCSHRYLISAPDTCVCCKFNRLP